MGDEGEYLSYCLVDEDEINLKQHDKEILKINVDLNLQYDAVLALVLQNEKQFLKYEYKQGGNLLI